jgi:Mrp family chromosome partitioning ATPase
MNMILEELSEERHGKVVIFDAPPVLATTEATILAQQVGQVVFVVEADKTSQSTIKDALEIIGHTENIGFVLNKTRVVVGDSQFGAYYSYGYGKPNAA